MVLLLLLLNACPCWLLVDVVHGTCHTHSHEVRLPSAIAASALARAPMTGCCAGVYGLPRIFAALVSNLPGSARM